MQDSRMAESVYDQYREYQKSEPCKKLLRLYELLDSLTVVFANFAEFDRMVGDYYSQEGIGETFSLRHVYRVEDAHFEATRLAQNYLFSAMSLRDRARKLRKRMSEDGKDLKVYDSEVTRRFIENRSVQFFESLRNFAAHRGLIPIRTQTTVGPGGNSQHMFVRVEEVLQDEDISAKAREYAVEQNNQIELRDLLTAYHREVESFYRWLPEEYFRLYADDVAECEEIARPLRRSVAQQHIGYLLKLAEGLPDQYTHLDLERGFEPIFTPIQWRAYDACTHDSEERADCAERLLREMGVADDDVLNIVRTMFENAQPH